jgi:hypothetical protein
MLEDNGIFANMDSPRPSVPETTPEVPAVPDICFGTVRESLGPSGSDSVPQPAPSLFPQLSESAAGAATRFEIGGPPGSSLGQGPQQGNSDFYSSQITENPSPDFYRGVNDSFGKFTGKP